MVNIFDNMFLLLSLRSGISLVFVSYAEGIAHFTELLGEVPNRWSKWEYFFCHHSCKFSHSSVVSSPQKVDRQMQMLYHIQGIDECMPKCKLIPVWVLATVVQWAAFLWEAAQIRAVCMACWAWYISRTSQSWHFTKVFTNNTYPDCNRLLAKIPFVYYQSRLCCSKNWCRFLEWLMAVLITHMVEKVMLRALTTQALQNPAVCGSGWRAVWLPYGPGLSHHAGPLLWHSWWCILCLWWEFYLWG